MKIIIDFPDDIKPKHYAGILIDCARIINEPKDWKYIIDGTRVGDEKYMNECRKQKNINFRLTSRSKDYIQMRREELKEKWGQDNYKWHKGTYTIEKED
jgi:hypothetical protein